MNNILGKRDNETDFEWEVRLNVGKVDREVPYVDYDWKEIVDILGTDVHYDTQRKSAYRDKKWVEYVNQKKINNVSQETLDEINEKLLEIKKEKVKFRDERNETNRQIRSLARIENIIDLLKESIYELSYEKPMLSKLNIKEGSSGKDGLLCLSDLHIGLETYNSVNEYNIEIAKERLKRVIEKTITYGNKSNIDKLHIILNGDLISAELHNSIKLSNAESLTRQIVLASEIVAECIYELSKHFYCCVQHNLGNHEAVDILKDDRSNRNNYSMIINEMLKLRLKDNDNVMFVNSINNYEMTVSRIKNLNVISAHGDQVTLNKCSEQLEMATGVKPDLIILGHYHKPMMMTHYDTEIYVNGSLVSTDDYAYKKKLYNPPSQLLLILDDYGVESSYILKV